MRKSIRPKHYEILRRIVCGESPKQIASAMGVNIELVYQLQHDPLFKQELQRVVQSVQERFVDAVAKREIKDPVKELIDEAKVEAMQVNLALMREASSETVRQRSAWDILDRAGYKPVEKVEAKHSVVVDEHVAENISKAVEDLKRLEGNAFSKIENGSSGWDDATDTEIP